MNCRLCKSSDVSIIYDDYIRDGAVGRLTDTKYKMYRCAECHTIWHDIQEGQNKDYYESEQYRLELEDDAKPEAYFTSHDVEVLEKLQYTGTDIYRDKIVVDVGAGGGSFLDFVHGVAKRTIAIEPSNLYRKDMVKRGHKCFAYAKDMIKTHEKADIVVSYDVIEHVDNPYEFLEDVYKIMDEGAVAYIGTPTDAPIMRELLGHTYEQFLFSYQHPWVLSDKAMIMIAEQIGFKSIAIKYVQRYGLSNTLHWLNKKEPKGHIKYDFIMEGLEELYKRNCEEREKSDYIIGILEK